jgi:hypothetical protein
MKFVSPQNKVECRSYSHKKIFVAVESVNFEMMIHVVVVSGLMLLCSDEDVVWG